MKLEKLGRNRKKKIVIGVVVFLCFTSALIYTGSRAKYKVTESIPLVNGTINYTPADLKVVAMYKKDDGDTNYQSVNEIPIGNYELNETESYCTTDGSNDKTNKDNNIIIMYENGNLGVNKINKKGTKCFFYFDQNLSLTSTERIQAMGLTATTGATSFTGVSTSNEGLKSGTDDDGTTYYFRGNVTNNWVRFAGFYWRIIRINGDGSIRMIYNGTTTDQTGTGTQISTSKYSHKDAYWNSKTDNAYVKDNTYVGYMYGSAGASTYAATHVNTNNSEIKNVVDDWYKTNIVDKGYSNKVSTGAGFCNDRSIASSSQNWWNDDTKLGYGTNATAYGPFSRILTSSNNYNSTQTPKFICTNASSDLFTVSESTKGNKKLTYPIGLITADEVIYAGGFGGTGNNSYYLYTNQVYWTMSPRNLYTAGGNADVFTVNLTGTLGSSGLYYGVFNMYGVRPVINLASNVKLTGSGTTSDPYKVV